MGGKTKKDGCHIMKAHHQILCFFNIHSGYIQRCTDPMFVSPIPQFRASADTVYSFIIIAFFS